MKDFIPYKCRCEALGDNKRRGGLYKRLNVRDNKLPEFTVPSSWKGKSVYIHGETFNMMPTTLFVNKKCGGFVNGNRDNVFRVTKIIKRNDTNSIAGDFSYLKNVYLTVRPSNFVTEANLDQNGLLSLKYKRGNSLGGLVAELYDTNLQLQGKYNVKGNSVKLPVNEDTLKILLVTKNECLVYNVRENNAENNAIRDYKISENDGKYVSYKLVGKSNGLVEVINNSQTENLSVFNIKYRVVNQSGIVSEGIIEKPDVKPVTSKVMKFAIDVPDVSFFEYFLEIELIRDGKTVATDSLKIPVLQSEPETYYSSEMSPITVTETDDKLTVSGTAGEDFKYVFNKKIGEFEKIERDCEDFIKQACERQQEPAGFSIIESNANYIAFISSKPDYQQFIVVYGDGEIGISIIGSGEYSIAMNGSIKNALFFGKYDIDGMYKQNDFNGKIKDLRWAVIHRKDQGIMIKCISETDASFEGGKFTVSCEGQTAFVLRPIRLSEGDVVREGRTLPGIG